MLPRILISIFCLCMLSACVNSTPNIPAADSPVSDGPSAPRFVPKKGKVLLILGQDLDATADYVNSGFFPTPGGITTYLSFYNMTGPSFPAYGALGQDIEGNALALSVDWGAGPLNAHRAAIDNPDSALVIGMGIAEGSGNTIWASGGLANIGVGAHDDNIRRLARFCKSIGKPVYLRIAYEFDGAWNLGYEKKSSYIYAYRRIVDVMREEGVKNVAYVWQASASPIDDIIDGRRENIRDWYPGDDYVDWMGLSWFLPPDEMPVNVATQRQLADELLGFARAKNKPVMIAESTPGRYDLELLTKRNSGPLWDGEAGSEAVDKTADEIWQEWFVPFFAYIHNNSDVIRAAAYINADWDSQDSWSAPYHQGYWGDSRLQVNADIRRHWLSEVSNDLFWLHGDRDLVDRLTDW